MIIGLKMLGQVPKKLDKYEEYLADDIISLHQIETWEPNTSTVDYESDKNIQEFLLFGKVMVVSLTVDRGCQK
ncbi:unnamed protein product [Caenorhabditis nigoni]